MLEQPLLFTGCSSIQFFNSPPFLNTVSQNTFGTLPLTVQYLCDLRDGIPRDGHHVLLIQPFLAKEDFPSGDKYFNHVSLLT